MAAQSMAAGIEQIQSRLYQGDVDYWKVHNLLVATQPITPIAFNWEIRRWEGWYCHGEDANRDPHRYGPIRLWETADGRLVGVVHAEYPGDVFLELHPDYPELEAEMLDWAEAHLAAPRRDGGGRELRLYVHEYDRRRQRLLMARGYEQTASWGMFRRMRLGSKPLPPAELAAGYTLRSLRPNDEGEYQRLADMLNAGFQRTIHTAAEARALTRTPSFRYDLHLVAALPDDSFAAHIGFTLDTVNRRGIVEPVCTHPAHLRKGLARSLMAEGLRRLQTLGAVDVTVDTGDAEAANAFYDTAGFSEGYKGYVWRKTV